MRRYLALGLAFALTLSTGLISVSADESNGYDVSTIKIGAIMVGDENEGYSNAHIEGIKAACEALGIPSDNLIMKYSIPENEECYDAAKDLIAQGCEVVFANSFSHESYILQAATEYPDIYFAHATGTQARTAGLSNFCNFFDSIYEARYVSGIAAGMKLQEMLDSGEATDPYVGYVGAYPYAEVVSGYTAFYLGIKSIVSDVHMDVQYTNSWFDITAEGECANALMDRGCVLIGQHADSTGAPSAVQAAYESGKKVYSVGYNIDMRSVAPDVALTSPLNNWQVAYQEVITDVLSGNGIQTDYCNGYENDGVRTSPLGEACAEGTEEAMDTAVEGIKEGTLHVFDTSTFTVDGAEVTSAYATDTDGDYVADADEAIFDGYYHESYFQSAPSFTLRIDGITELN